MAIASARLRGSFGNALRLLFCLARKILGGRGRRRPIGRRPARGEPIIVSERRHKRASLPFVRAASRAAKNCTVMLRKTRTKKQKHATSVRLHVRAAAPGGASEIR